MQCFHGEIGEIIRVIPLEYFVGLSRKKISALCLEGLDIRVRDRFGRDFWILMGSQYGNVLNTVTLDTDHGVTVAFEDGDYDHVLAMMLERTVPNPLQGQILLSQKSTIQPTPIPHDQPCIKVYRRASSVLCTTLTRSWHSMHPAGIFSWGGKVNAPCPEIFPEAKSFTVLKNPDPQRQESWTFQILNTWKDDRDPRQITQPQMPAELKQMAAKIADPFKSPISMDPRKARLCLSQDYTAGSWYLRITTADN